MQEAAENGTMAAASKVNIPEGVPFGVIWKDPATQKKYVRTTKFRVIMVFEVRHFNGKVETLFTYSSGYSRKKSDKKTYFVLEIIGHNFKKLFSPQF